MVRSTWRWRLTRTNREFENHKLFAYKFTRGSYWMCASWTLERSINYQTKCVSVTLSLYCLKCFNLTYSKCRTNSNRTLIAYTSSPVIRGVRGCYSWRIFKSYIAVGEFYGYFGGDLHTLTVKLSWCRMASRFKEFVHVVCHECRSGSHHSHDDPNRHFWRTYRRGSRILQPGFNTSDISGKSLPNCNAK